MARKISRAGLVPYTARERRATAYHEAGHAVACLVLGLPFKYVTIKPATDKRGNECGGHVCYDFGRLKAATLKMWTRERNTCSRYSIPLRWTCRRLCPTTLAPPDRQHRVC